MVTQAVLIGVETVVHITLPHHLTKFLGIEHIHLMSIGLYGNTCIEIDFHLTFFATLGGDDDDTIGSAATIDRGRCGIFKHLNGLDVVAVQLVHASLSGHTIDDV